MTDWHAWHGQYDDDESSLTRRLHLVQQHVHQSLSGRIPVRRVLSLCAGDGRDVIPVIAGQDQRRRPELMLVELDPDLAAAATSRATEAGVEATVVVGDAGSTRNWRHWLPVDLLMLCGIFGNIDDLDIHKTIEASTAMVSPGGVVIWTRGHVGGDDLRPQVREWFRQAGFSEEHFDAEPVGYGVGVSRLQTPTRTSLPDQLFTFIR